MSMTTVRDLRILRRNELLDPHGIEIRQDNPFIRCAIFRGGEQLTPWGT